MPAIVVASANPVKIQAVLAGFQRVIPDQAYRVRGAPAESGVSRQPMTDAETRQGALNRARAAQAANPGADFWAGVEGGCEELHGRLACFAWVVILGPTQAGEARTGLFFLPERVADLVRQGVELGEADDQVFGRVNSKQGNGAVGLLTGDVIDRLAYYEHAVVLALVPFRNPALYPAAARPV